VNSSKTAKHSSKKIKTSLPRKQAGPGKMVLFQSRFKLFQIGFGRAPAFPKFAVLKIVKRKLVGVVVVA
jgi:hypothetical protein